MNGLKKRLDDAKGRWVEELPHVLWTYRTTPRKSTGETPFSMTYGAETVIPLESGFPTMRSSAFTSDGNDELLKRNLDLIEERRENARVQLAYYQHKLKQDYDISVKLRSYRITSVAGIGAYYLEDLDERAVFHPWNVNNLKRYYY